MADPKSSSTAVAVREPSAGIVLTPDAGVTYNLDRFPDATYNRLIPTQTIAMPSDLYRPVIQVVQLDPADREGKSPDHYKSSDVPSGHRALTARGISKLVTAAGVSFFDERRIDDGRDPDVMGVSVMASMVLPTGQRIQAPGSQLINIRTWFKGDASAAEVAKFRKQFFGNVATRARNRAARGLLSLRQSYPERDINKPFAVVSFAPNMDHPKVQEAMIAAMIPAATAGYGPDTRQIAAGQIIEVDEAPDLDPEAEDAAAAAYAKHAQLQSGAGAGGPEPEWAADLFSDGPAEPAIVSKLREKAAASTLEGEASLDQKAAINERLVRPLGPDAPALVGAGMKAVWNAQPRDDGKFGITAAQAQAILELSQSDDFIDTWRATFGSAAAS